jgi:hypothetical protein
VKFLAFSTIDFLPLLLPVNRWQLLTFRAMDSVFVLKVIACAYIPRVERPVNAIFVSIFVLTTDFHCSSLSKSYSNFLEPYSSDTKMQGFPSSLFSTTSA